MTIGIFIDDRYPISGGSTRSVELQVAALQKLGHEVVVICPHSSHDLPYVYKVPSLKAPLMPEGTLRSSRRLAQTIANRFKFDIVHSQTERGALLLAKRVAKLTGAKHIHTFHGNYAFLMPYYPLVARLLILVNDLYVRWVLSAPRVVMPDSLSGYYAVNQIFEKLNLRSLAMIASLVDDYITPMPYINDGIQKVISQKTKGHVVPTGIDSTIFESIKRQRPYKPPLKVVHMGRIVREKRSLTVLQAFLLAAAKVQDIELTVIGPGDQRKKLQILANDSPYTDKIHIVGPIYNRQELVQELTDADVFITASYRFETQGMVLLEAAAAGLALVYCDDLITVGVDSTNAILTKPDAQSLANGLIKLASDRETTKRMGQASRQIAAGLSTGEIEKQIVAIYNQLLKKINTRISGLTYGIRPHTPSTRSS